ncbi:hypothetical protein JTB14_009095 [Gonioctena quinquepunctata]|nr:hypothetical protein JTB14_009095 [Gonioctena quinquepunctata]
MSVSYTSVQQNSNKGEQLNGADKATLPLMSNSEGDLVRQSAHDDANNSRIPTPSRSVADINARDVETTRSNDPNIPEIEITETNNVDVHAQPPRTDMEEGKAEHDEERRALSPYPPSERPNFSINGFGFDHELGSTLGSTDIPDVNIYQHKKTLAQGMMDLALFSANANQLRYVLESYARHPFYYPSMILISLSLLLQVAIGVGLIWNATYNVKDEKEICIANKINNFTVIGIFLVTVINVFVSAFGVADPVPG